MRHIAPVARVSAPQPPARPVADASGSRASVAHVNKSPAGNQPWFGRDECHCDDGPERMSKRAVSARW